MAFLRAQAVLALAKVKYGAIVDDLSLVVTPHRIRDATGFYLAHVARNQPVDEFQAVRAANPVLRHWRQVEDAGAVANREIFE